MVVKESEIIKMVEELSKERDRYKRDLDALTGGDDKDSHGAYRLSSMNQKDLDKYILKRDMPAARRGTIFVHAKEDKIRGSIMQGCITNAWTSDGNCQGGLCAQTISLHLDAINRIDDSTLQNYWFKKIPKTARIRTPEENADTHLI